MLVINMSAPHIGTHTPTSPAHLLTPTFCRRNMSRFIGCDPNTWKCPPTGQCAIWKFCSLQRFILKEVQRLKSRGANIICGCLRWTRACAPPLSPSTLNFPEDKVFLQSTLTLYSPFPVSSLIRWNWMRTSNFLCSSHIFTLYFFTKGSVRKCHTHLKF